MSGIERGSLIRGYNGQHEGINGGVPDQGSPTNAGNGLHESGSVERIDERSLHGSYQELIKRSLSGNSDGEELDRGSTEKNPEERIDGGLQSHRHIEVLPREQSQISHGQLVRRSLNYIQKLDEKKVQAWIETFDKQEGDRNSLKGSASEVVFFEEEASGGSPSRSLPFFLQSRLIDRPDAGSITPSRVCSLPLGSIDYPEKSKQRVLSDIHNLIVSREEIVENTRNIMLFERTIYDLNEKLWDSEDQGAPNSIRSEVSHLNDLILGLKRQNQEDNKNYLLLRSQLGDAFKKEIQDVVQVNSKKVPHVSPTGVHDFTDDRLEALKSIENCLLHMDEIREEFSRDLGRTTLAVIGPDGKKYLLFQNHNESEMYQKITKAKPPPESSSAEAIDSGEKEVLPCQGPEEAEIAEEISDVKTCPETCPRYSYTDAIDYAYSLNPDERLLQLRDVNEKSQTTNALGFVDRFLESKGVVGLVEKYRIYSNFYQALLSVILPGSVAPDDYARSKDRSLPLKERYAALKLASCKAGLNGVILLDPSAWGDEFIAYYDREDAEISGMQKSKIHILDLQNRIVHAHYLVSYQDPSVPDGKGERQSHYYHIQYDCVQDKTSWEGKPIAEFPKPEEVNRYERFPLILPSV